MYLTLGFFYSKIYFLSNKQSHLTSEEGEWSVIINAILATHRMADKSTNDRSMDLNTEEKNQTETTDTKATHSAPKNEKNNRDQYNKDLAADFDEIQER